MVVTQIYCTEHFGVATQSFNRQVPVLNSGRAPLIISNGNGSVLVIPENAEVQVLLRVGHDRFFSKFFPFHHLLPLQL